jgi:mannose-6-phosphate isomerase
MVSWQGIVKNTEEASMKVKKLSGVIKPYDWGKTDFLPSLLGIPADGTCKAEYWMGSHPSGDATL